MRSGVCERGFVSAASAKSQLVCVVERSVYFAFVLVLASVIWLNREAFGHLLFPVIEDVRLEGQFVHLDRLSVDRLARDSVGRYFFSIDLQAIQRSIEALPWVKHARVTKVWPRTLHVFIEEHQAEARWGEDALISPRAVVFRPAGAADQHLPTLYAREGRGASTLARYREAKELFAQAGVSRIKTLSQDLLGAWVILLSNGISIRVGDMHWERRLRRFVALWQTELSEKSDRIRSVDLRYLNGCAVAWKN